MKLLVIVVDRARQDEALDLLRQSGVEGFSLVPGVLGKGDTGGHFGTRAFPGDNTMIWTLVPADQLPRLKDGLAALQRAVRAGEGLMAFSADAQRLL